MRAWKFLSFAACYCAAPEVFVLCEDTSVIGAVFFVMERRRGIVVRHSIPPELESVTYG